MELTEVVISQIDALRWAKAEKLFRSKSDFDIWLTTPNCAIANRKPVDFLGSDTGYREVLNLLGRMEYGIMA